MTDDADSGPAPAEVTPVASPAEGNEASESEPGPNDRAATAD
jgi:hypothetical protein